MNFLQYLMQITVLSLMFAVFNVSASAPLRALTPDQGLTQGSVTDLLFDKEGFLWIATRGGLNRFDSNKIYQMSSASAGLKEIAFHRLLQHSNGHIFAGTSTGDLYRFDESSGYIETYASISSFKNSINHTGIIDIAELEDNHLLLISYDSLYKLSLASGNIEKLFDLHAFGDKENWLRSVIHYKEYALIAVSNGLLAIHLTNKNAQYIPYLAKKSASEDQLHAKVLNIAKERLWIGTVEGLYSVPLQELDAYLAVGSTFTTTTEIPSLNIWKLKWRDDYAFIPTELGLYRFDEKTKQTDFILNFSDAGLGLFDNTILDIAADDAGGYWLASRYNGAYYWHPKTQAFTQIVKKKDNNLNLSSNITYGLLADDNDTLWIGSSNGLNKLNLKTQVNQSFLVNPDPKIIQHEGSIFNIQKADDEHLWLATAKGLRLFNTQTGTLDLPKNVKSEDMPYFDSRQVDYYFANDEWYLILNEQLLKYSPNTGELITLSNELNTSNTGRSSIIGHDRYRNLGLFISTPDKIWLWQFEEKTLHLLYQAPDFQPNLLRLAYSAKQDNEGRLWVGMSGVGLLGFDADTFEHKHTFSVNEALLSDTINDLQIDKFGDIWGSSHYGLIRLNTKDLQIETFSQEDGLYTHEYNANSSTRLQDGRLAFGSMHGVTIVDSTKLQDKVAEPRVIITSFSLLSQTQNAVNGNLNEKHFTLSHEDLGITLQFSAMNFSDNHKMRYRYWLEGKKNINYPEQRDNSIVFPQLSPGDYVFNVVTISPTTGAISSPARIYLHVKPSPWLSKWALFSYGLIAILLLHWFYRTRREQVKLIQAAHINAVQSEQRLKQALASVDSGAWEWVGSTNQLFASRIHSMLGYSKSMNPMTLKLHLSLIHPDDKESFEQNWARLLKEPEQSFSCVYRMQHQDGRWLWFRDQGKATEFASDQSVKKVIGTYTNITETRATEEKARLFGEAFKQTRDWVVILDKAQRIMAANQSFCDAFGTIERYIQQPRIHHLGISLVRRRFYTKMLKEMTPGSHWQDEEVILTPDGRERPAIINVSAIGEQDEISFYVLVFTDITAQKTAEDELRYLANYDVLTGLPNRALLMDRIYHGIDQAKQLRKSLALCFIDLDKFKQINDSLGHDVGDLLLKEVAKRLSSTLRKTDTVARFGGDEFIILLEGYKSEDNISHVARKILSIVGEPMQLGQHSVSVSPSIGIAVYPDDALTAVELIKHADVAMYQAKEAGRNNFQYFTADMNEKAHMRLALETRFRKALQHDEFVNYYQPIIDSRTRQIVGAEVLIRWQSSEGLIPPIEFIPLAEELRLITNLTNALLDKALSDLHRWHQQGFKIYLSVNISTQHLEQPALVTLTHSLLTKYAIEPKYLRFEVTESDLMRDHNSAIDIMKALSNLGIQLALDDFGTGYSSLKYLKELPIDGIKIDRSFVKDIGLDNNDETIIDAMLSMSKSLGMYCIAEGVETEDQLAFFSQRQSYLIQGYLFSKPLPATEFVAFVNQNLNKLMTEVEV